ncbi:Protein of unknown function [Hydrocarboniphaga daqingensis]|uniref:DUF1302 domain-containing protein n=1 Tax=Hydrocarboniphaga daqingensis TaxID=490188 RepID=A0A1M5RX76_9GAMM|nr:DUF1302 family protein [Hydrocarboniphaga daqingensis]SHH30952.1 Protein of unknown function [Hydrocarboniphaga daqingensis]
MEMDREPRQRPMWNVLLLSTVMMSASTVVRADELQWPLMGGTFGVTGLLTSGVAVRLEDRDLDLLGKTNVPGQQNLCAPDDCMSLSGNPEPNQRLINARGQFSGVNTDSGNQNYDQYDVIAATTKLTPVVSYENGPVLVKLRGIAFYDPVNDGFRETRSNTLYQPARGPRGDDLNSRFAHGFKWREAFIALSNDRGTLTVGNQLLPWGEASLTQFNTLAAINPIDANVARMPGSQINEFLKAVPAVTLSGDLGRGFSAELFYQLQWVKLEPDTVGSYFSTNNVVGGGEHVIIGLGQYVHDPNRQYQPPFPNSLISSSTRTAYLMGEKFGEPRDLGQYGVQLKYYAEDFNNGTEFGFQFLNYHSRVPYVSAIAANASCTRQGIAGSFTSALVACRGFNGLAGGLEPLPVDTLRPFIDYPEDVQVFGPSFNTTVGAWSLAGEYAYRPNMPLQILVSDVVFAGLSPAFPEQNIPVPLGALGDAAPFTIPGARTSVPDFISGYRGITIGANDRIRGYERFDVGQFALIGIRQFGATENGIGADALTLAIEVSGSNIFDLPDRDQLQLEGAGDRTHFSPGADGTGDPNGQPNSLRINPTQQTSGFATAFAWGYRMFARATFSNLYRGISLVPTLLWFHDINGVSSANTPNYLKGRKMAISVLEAQMTQNFRISLQHQMFSGGGAYNLISDRDNVALSLAYAF